MKTIMLFFAIITGCAIQVSGQAAFTNVSLNMIHDREVVSFTIPHEVNIRQYRVEASNDSLNFDIIGTFPSKGNSVLARNYSYELLDHSYKYYRLGIVGMNASLQYSAVLTPGKEMQHHIPGKKSEPMHTESSIVRIK